MVIVKIWGGLGNQLFQYSFGKYLAVKLGTTVKYDIQTTNSFSSFTQRDFALSTFNAVIDTATEAEVNNFKYFRNDHLARLERKLAQQLPLLLKKHFVEQNIPVAPASLAIKDNCYYEGYWQSYQFLLPIETLLRKEIVLNKALSVGASQILAQIRQSASAAIHVRRGDYLTHTGFINCSMEYYHAAIQYIKQLQNQVQFFVFSDDIAWCRQNFTGAGFTFVEGNSNYEDLVLMSKCHHQIIANSTFSWWGAWLNNNPEKKVLTPRTWHSKKDTRLNYLLPDDWIKLDI